MRSQAERFRLLRVMLLLLALALLVNGCDLLVPDAKEPHQVCGAVDTIWAYNSTRTDSVIGGIAQMCYTEWRAPAPAGDE